ncbi:MAG TPA: hypothetical protein PKM88_00835 [bacterium]|nr:hypothetical protein [bacterium]
MKETQSLEEISEQMLAGVAGGSGITTTYTCNGCGYSVVAHAAPTRCPECGGTSFTGTQST